LRFSGSALLIVLLFCVPAFAKFDPEFVWTTLETPHFLIHHHQGAEEIAGRAALVAEDVHGRLVPRIKWEPRQKTHIILVDAMDEANGLSLPIPYNQMVLFLTRPIGEPGFAATAYDDWMRALITHEYTHILQLDMVSEGPEKLQKVLGRIYFPNMFQPLWMIEGLATYEETEQTSGGRGRSPAADMVLRMAALDNALPPLGQMSVFPDTWPSGQVPYLFGESFTRFISEKYGREKLAEISTAYSGRGFPFLVESTGMRVLDERYTGLYDEWAASLRDQYGKQREEIIKRGATQSTPLTRTGYENLSPAFSPDGSLIAFSVLNGDEFPGVYLMSSDGSGGRRLLENVFPVSTSGSGLSWRPDGSAILYTKIEFRSAGTDFYSDLYAYVFKDAQVKQVTYRLRARDPHVSPDGKKVVFVVNRLGATRLAVLHLTDLRALPLREKDITYLTAKGHLLYASPRFSPDGSKIAVSVWQPGGNRDVWILDSQGSKIEEISGDRAIDGAPAWSPDGRYLYFSSDRTGVFNIFAYQLETKRLFQVTNVVGGAFMPAVSPDGKRLAFSSYSSKGFDIHIMDLDESQWGMAEPYTDPYPLVRYEEEPVEATSRPYSPLQTIYPRFWLPWFGYSRESGWLVGALTFGQDAVQRHQYFATALYGPRKGRTWYSLDYFYDRFAPTHHLVVADTDITYTDLLADPSGSRDYVESEKTFGYDLIIAPVRVATQHAITLGYRFRKITALTEIPAGYTGVVPAEGALASGRFSYRFNSSRRYGFSISPEQGRTVEVGYERFDQALGSDFEIKKYTVDWIEYVNFPWKHHVLQARAFAGISAGEVIPQGAFQLGGDNPGDITLSVDDRSVHLRGYPVNALRGRNAALASLEYRFPLMNLERGWDTKPIFSRRFHGALFYEAGNAWDRDFDREDLRRSLGAEARLDLTLAYYLPVTVRFVVAQGLNEDGESLAYIGLWVPLEL
jgi:Tol biopolymer transport system component